jgi:uncharacterized protein
MQKIKDAASEFLANKRVAVTGVSRHAKDHGSNVVYKRLRDRGYEVYAVNPNTDEVEGDRCYHDLHSIPDGVDAVVIATTPETAEATMHERAELGITNTYGCTVAPVPGASRRRRPTTAGSRELR